MDGNRNDGRTPEDQSRLAASISRVEGVLQKLTEPAEQQNLAGLRAAWAELVRVLALEPTPQLRVCAACGNSGMRAATRCGHCWISLPPLPSEVIP